MGRLPGKGRWYFWGYKKESGSHFRNSEQVSVGDGLGLVVTSQFRAHPSQFDSKSELLCGPVTIEKGVLITLRTGSRIQA